MSFVGRYGCAGDLNGPDAGAPAVLEAGWLDDSKNPSWFGLLNVDDSGELSNRDADRATVVFGRREVHAIGRNIRTDGQLWSAN
jgi:hypothetical protein